MCGEGEADVRCGCVGRGEADVRCGCVYFMSLMVVNLSPCLLQYMDYDYHTSFQRLVLAYKEAEREMGEAVMHSVDMMVENSKSLSFENDLHYFLQDYPQPFTPPNPFHFVPFDTDDVSVCVSVCE